MYGPPQFCRNLTDAQGRMTSEPAKTYPKDSIPELPGNNELLPG